MKHLSDGALRRYVDEPASLPVADAEHLSNCDRCASTLGEAQRDAGFAHAAMGARAYERLDTDDAWATLQHSLREDVSGSTRTSTSTTPFRAKVLKAPVLAAAGALLVVGGATTAAANDWLPIFHTESITPISVNVDDLTRLPDLSAYGRWQLKSDPKLVDVPDASTASTRTGIDVATPNDLPTGVEGSPQYQVLERQVATFTFSESKAKDAARQAGEALPPLPPSLDGAVLRLELGPAVVQTWSQQSGFPTLVVGQVVAPTASSNGVALSALRDALLSLPGLPDDVAAELRAVTSDGTTLPLPVPADKYTTEDTEVAGKSATLLMSRDQSLAGVVWLDGDVVTVVAGPLDTQEVLSVADGLG